MKLHVTCACGWEAEGDEEALYVRVVEHGRDFHNMDVTREEMLAMAEPIED